MKIPKPKCNKCGEVAPIYNEMSNKVWTVYKTKESCKCGGKFKIDFSSEEGE